jgi:hypothetical protein
LHTKNPDLVIFSETFGNNGNFWYVFVHPFGIFGIFTPVLVCCTMRNLATLERMPVRAVRLEASNGGAQRGDQIGRIFAFWAIVYFGKFSEYDET